MEGVAPEHLLMSSAKAGNLPRIRSLLQLRAQQSVSLNVDCKGGLGWTPLHLSCHCGHKDVVEALLTAGAGVDVQDNAGDTPLHKAARAGRKEIVLALLRYDASSAIVNGAARIPKDVTEDDEIITMLEAAERREMRRKEAKLLEAAGEGNVSALSNMLREEEAPSLECRDPAGNTPLHCAASRGQKRCVVKLLQSGADPSIKNNSGQTAADLVRSEELRLVLAAHRATDLKRGVQKMEGPLWKNSRFLGWRRHWVVVEDGTVSWYLRQADAQAGVRRQGCKCLTHASCVVKPWDHCFFVLRCFDGAVLYFKVDSKTNSLATRKKWLDAFEAHSSSEEKLAGAANRDVLKTETALAHGLQEAHILQQSLESEVSVFASMVKNQQTCAVSAPLLLKARETSNLSGETCAVLHRCLEQLSQQEEVWSLKLEQEVEKNRALTEALQILAAEHHELKQPRRSSRGSWALSTLPGDDFYDALSDSESELSVSGFLSVASQSCEEDEGRDSPLLCHPSALGGPTGMSGEGNHGDQPAQRSGVEKHRTCLPAPMFSRNDVSIWSILKKCIGMELSKIAMPVIFNEPLSFLQRLSEYMEHTHLVHQANATSDSIERMKCVAAFAVSAVASQWERTGKPFNPLLGETFELIREDLGFRWVSEQVSHHPPVSAFQAEGLEEDFVFHGSIYPKLKFWGKSIEAEPRGVITLELPKHNEAYTWTNPTCCVHNIIVGQLWIEQYGNVDVVNHKTGDRCNMTFRPCGLFGKELHKVEGYILDRSKKKLCAIYGKWTECLYTIDAAAFDAHKKTEKKSSEEKKSSKRNSVDEEPEEMPPPDAETVQVIPGSELIWKITPRPGNSAKFYAFSTFAMQLNALDKSLEGLVPPTDSRLRPDIRALEDGDIDLASAEKKRLEEKQRTARKNRSKSAEEWKTRWFQQGPNPHNKAQDWLYLKGYWDRSFTHLPDIY